MCAARPRIDWSGDPRLHARTGSWHQNNVDRGPASFSISVMNRHCGIVAQETEEKPSSGPRILSTSCSPLADQPPLITACTTSWLFILSSVMSETRVSTTCSSHKIATRSCTCTRAAPRWDSSTMTTGQCRHQIDMRNECRRWYRRKVGASTQDSRLAIVERGFALNWVGCLHGRSPAPARKTSEIVGKVFLSPPECRSLRRG